jgi:hypothetical protein
MLSSFPFCVTLEAKQIVFPVDEPRRINETKLNVVCCRYGGITFALNSLMPVFAGACDTETLK